MANAKWSISAIAAALLLSVASEYVRSRPVMVDNPVGARQRIAGAQNNVQLQNLAKFAVDQYNAKQTASLVYVRLVSAEQQVVAGIMYDLVLEAAGQGGVSKLYEARVWVKPWQNFRSLQDFKEKPTSRVHPHSETARPDGKAASDNEEVSKKAVSRNDTVVKEAAEQALKTLQDRSNTLAPYELRKVVSVHAQLHGKSTTYDLMLITQRGSKQEQIDAEVVQMADGTWTVKDVHLHH